MNTPSFYRGRAKAINYFTQLSKDDLEKKQLQVGFIPEHLQKQAEAYAQEVSKELSNETLNFVELTSYSTWFAMHPEKMAGVEKANTGFIFPVMVKGTKSDVVAMIDKALKPSKAPSNEASKKNKEKPTNKANEPSNETDKSKKLRLLKMKAKALKLKLKLELEL